MWASFQKRSGFCGGKCAPRGTRVYKVVFKATPHKHQNPHYTIGAK